MVSSPISEVTPSDKSYCKFVIETFQEYALSKLEDSLLWGAIHMDFENWTEEIWERLNGNTWSTIKECCIPRSVWIDEPEDNLTRSDILLKLISTKYDDDLKDWDIDRIRKVEENFSSILRGIRRRKQKLLDNIPDEPQIQSALSKPFPYAYRPHNHQPAPTRIISNPAPPTSKFRKGCECIPERSTAQKLPTQAPSSEAAQVLVQAPSAQVLPVQAPSVKALPAQVPAIPASSVLAPSVPAHLTQVLPVEQATSTKETVTPDNDVTSEEFVTSVKIVTSEQVVTPEEILSASQKAEASHHWATYYPHYKEKLGMTKSAHNPLLVRPPPKPLSLPGDWFDCVGKFATYHPHYKETLGMTKSVHDPFVLRPPPELSSLLGASSDYKDKIMKSAYGIKVGNHRFTIYHPHYKDKIMINPTRTFVCAAGYLYFGCSLDSLGNLSAAFFLAHDSGAYTAEPGLVTKKREPPRIFSLFTTDTGMPSCSRLPPLYLSHHFQPPALFFSPTFASFSSLLTSEASFNLSYAGQTVEFSPDDQALLNKRLQWQITDKSRGLRYVKLDPRDTHLLLQIGYVICLADATNKVNVHWSSIKCKRVTHRRGFLAAELYAMTYRVDVEKRHWGRYQIVRAKSNQHQHYGMDETGEYKRANTGI